MRETWDAIVTGILSGELSLETVPPVAPWPPKGGAAGEFVLVMHRAAPGAVGLVGRIGDRSCMAVVTNDRLASACLRERAEWFDSLGPLGLLGSEIILTEALWREVRGVRIPLIWVAGAEAAGLLRELERVRREGLH